MCQPSPKLLHAATRAPKLRGELRQHYSLDLACGVFFSAINKTLPQLCRVCRKLKIPELGEFKKVGSRAHDWYWVCHNCQPPQRVTPPVVTKASWLERKVIPVLTSSGYNFIREYPLGAFRFDFALPRLWLLIEADSYLWHRRPRQIQRDQKKDTLASDGGWFVARVRDPDIEGWTRMAIDRRAEELGLTV